MTKPLRKYHFMLWRILAVVVPVVFVYAVMGRPDYRDARQNDSAFPFLFHADMMDSILVCTVEVKQPLSTPSCAVFLVTKKEKTLLGKLDRQGSYRFQVPVLAGTTEGVSILLFDLIHKREIVERDLAELLHKPNRK